MAIAGIAVQTAKESFDAVRERLTAAEGVAAVEEGAPCLLAAVVEADAARLEGVLASLAAWDGVLNVGLASVNYEDDLDERGCIPCPPHKTRCRGAGEDRRKRDAACFAGPASDGKVGKGGQEENGGPQA